MVGRPSILEQVAREVWRRRPGLLLPVLAVAATVVMIGMVLAPALVIFALLFEVPAGTVARWGAVPATICALGGAYGIWTAPSGRAIAGWVRGRRDDPDRAWHDILAAVDTMVVRVLVVIVPLHLAITVPVLVHLASLSWLGGAAMVVTVLATIALASLPAGGWLHQMLRPPLDEVAEQTTLGRTLPKLTFTLRRRLIVPVVAACYMTGIAATAAAGLAEGDERRAVAGAFGAMVVAAYIAVLYRAGLVEPTLAPVRELTAAVQAVRRGDLHRELPVTSADELGDLIMAFNEMQRGLRERAALHAAFGSYVDPGLAERVLHQDGSAFQGEELEVTAMFVDVRGFTSLAELTSAKEVVARLNRLFELVVPVVRDQGGHTNTFLGDGFLAVFGTPNRLHDHADRAVAAAIEIQRLVHAELHPDLCVGVGINTGPVIAGTIGGGGRLEYTVIGDTVNVASRVESLTKETGDQILLTEATRAALGMKVRGITDRGEVPLRGKAAGIRLLALNPCPRVASARRAGRPRSRTA